MAPTVGASGNKASNPSGPGKTSGAGNSKEAKVPSALANVSIVNAYSIHA